MKKEGNKKRSLDEIREEVKESKHDEIEKLAKISDDKKSLIVRIPQEIRRKFGVKAGDQLKFYAKFEDKKKPKLEISIIKC